MTPTETLILRDLEFGPATVRDLSAVLKIHRYSVLRVLRKMRAKKLVRICNWEVKLGGAAAVWDTNPDGLRDAPRPPKLTPTQMHMRWRENHMDDHKRYQRNYRIRVKERKSSSANSPTSTPS